MCGIAGIYNRLSGKPVLKGELENMVASLNHRGPDECGFLSHANFGMGMSRLSIIDLSGGSQPIHNENKRYWIVFNGEIFNYRELREKLLSQGHSFITHSDTEVILHLYEQHGTDFVHQMNGQFAIAIWDSRDRKLLLARDRVGIRPLFYAETSEGLVFASEMKAIFQTGLIKPEIDPQALAEIYTFWVNIPPNTSFKGIRELPPGHLMIVTPEKTEIQKFWSVTFPETGDFNQSSESRLIEDMQALIYDAVTLRLRADVPVASFLSGGIDSSIISTLVKKYHNNDLITFSVAFKDKDYDERYYQELMASHLQTQHHTVEVDDRAIAEAFIDAVWFAEKPLMRTAPAPLFALSKLVRQNNIKVVLTGEGADEMFAGYNIFKEDKIRRFWARQPQSEWRPLLLSRLYSYILKSNNSISPFWQAFFKKDLQLTGNPYYSHLIRWDNTSKIRIFFNDAIRQQFDSPVHLQTLQQYVDPALVNWHPLNRAQYLESILFMSGYLLSSQGDRMMMGNSVEGRFPFLDYRVIEFAAKLPPDIKLRSLNEKYILKQGYKHLLPPSIIHRVKQPYRAPIRRVFLAENTPPLLQELLSTEKIKDYGYFNAAAMNQLISKARNDDNVVGAREEMALVSLASVQLLHYHFIEQFSSRHIKLPELRTYINLNS